MQKIHMAASLLSAGLLALSSSAVFAAPVLMSADWAKEACNAWNKDPVLTNKLVETGWMKNDKGRGYKIMQIYRMDCQSSPRIEMKIANKDGKAMCVQAGRAQTRLDPSVDYAMWAETKRWVEMGNNEYGPMKAMMFGRLKFQGPKGEAMGNMAPFTNFLHLVGKVPSNTDTCPTA